MKFYNLSFLKIKIIFHNDIIKYILLQKIN